jgi:hypothetical protein
MASDGSTREPVTGHAIHGTEGKDKGFSGTDAGEGTTIGGAGRFTTEDTEASGTERMPGSGESTRSRSSLREW